MTCHCHKASSPLYHTHTYTPKHTQVIAITCLGTKASSGPTSQNFKVIAAPAVIVTMTFGGSLSAKDVTPAVQDKLSAAVAESIGVPRALVQIVSFRDARRRLLALAVTFRILAANAADAEALRQKVVTADIQVCVCMCVCMCMSVCTNIHTRAWTHRPTVGHGMSNTHTHIHTSNTKSWLFTHPHTHIHR